MATDNPLIWRHHSPELLDDMLETLEHISRAATSNGQSQDMVSMITGTFGLTGVADSVRAVADANKEVAIQIDLARAEIRAHLKAVRA